MTRFDPAVTDRLENLIGADRTMIEKFADRAGDLAVSLVVAVLILVATFWAARWAAGLTRRVIGRLHRGEDPDRTLQGFASSLVRSIVVIVGLVAVLQQVGVQTTSIIAVLGAASLAIGLALQGALSNVAAGVMILLFRPYRVGDHIEVAGRQGRVRQLDLFVTELATPDNVKVVIPNGKVFGDVIVNFSFHDRRRVDVVFKVDLKRDLPAVLAGLRERASVDPRVLKDPEPAVEVLNMSEAFVEAALRAWVERPDYAAVKSDLMLAARLLADGRTDLPAPAPTKVKKKAPPAPKRRLGLARKAK